MTRGIGPERNQVPWATAGAGDPSVFALKGTLQAAFPATVLREDDHAELDALSEPPDQTLEGVASDTALVNVWD